MKPTFERFSVFLFAIAIVLCACFAHAQTYFPFGSLGNAQFFDNNGNLLSAGVLYSYQAGTTTQQATYTDYTGTVPNPNPIPFGAGARVGIWLNGTEYYKFVLCLQNDGAACAPGDVLFSVDQVPGSPNAGASSTIFTGTFISGSSTPATTGILRLASGDAICWRTAAGTANLCITKSSADVITLAGLLSIQAIISASSNPAQSGIVRLASGDTACWRNNANTADLCISKGSDDNLYYPNGFSLGGGTVLATTNQSGTVSICMTTNCQLTTPALNGVVISGTPTVGQELVATSPTAASWGTNSALVANSITALGGTVNISGNTNVSVMTKSVTMPTTGCPCRAFVSYGVFVDFTNAGQAAFYVSDATNNFATAETATTGSASNFGVSGSSFSTGTYTNSQAVTFTLYGNSNAGGTSTVLVNNGPGTPQASWLNVAIFSSN